jgi:hypothetical protein
MQLSQMYYSLPRDGTIYAVAHAGVLTIHAR